MSTSLKWTKVAAGSYDAVTGPGELDRYEVTLCAGTFAYSQQGWFLSYPGQARPDSVFNTLREAKAAAQAWHDIDVALSAEEQS